MVARGLLMAMALLAFAVLALPTRSYEPEPQPTNKSEVAPFLKEYCLRCHGPSKSKGDLTFHDLARSPAKQAEVWKKIRDQIEAGTMPPKAAKQPRDDQRRQFVQWIAGEFRQAGVADGRAHPSRGNWVDHDALFAARMPKGSTASRGRLWRITGQAYEEFIQELNGQHRLGFKTYGPHRVRPPWELAPQKGFRDYSSQHRIGEAELEHHMRNAVRVAKAMVAGLRKRGAIKELSEFVEAKEPPGQEQVKAAAQAVFDGVLGRKPSQEELDRYAGFLGGSVKTLGAEKAVEQLLVAILFHPEVMYRVELPRENADRALMAPRDLARALAYALTDREPDEALLKAAAAGKLARPEEIRAQVVRILQERTIAKPRILRFFQEYFGYTEAIEVFKDSATRKAAGFRGKNDWHPNFFVSDTDRLIESILADDKNVLRELLTTPKTFALTGDTKQATGVKKNATKPFSLFAQTALDIYEIDIKRADWAEDRAFEMPKQHRMGILTHPSWLIAHSTNFDNHAIDRGRWIRERLLGGKIPEVPVTVDAQLPDEPEHTLRHRMRVTTEAYCWKCHQHMDPLGLPFEQFDHFGRFRLTELKKPVQTSGRVEQSGDPELDGPVQDPFELLRKLAASKRVEQVFVRHAFRYFLGRNETLADGPALVEAHRAYVKSGGSMNALIVSLLTSDAFLYRTSTRGGDLERSKP